MAKPESVQIEFSVAWIEKNPAWFAEKYRKFFEMYSREYEIRAVARSPFFWLIAESVEK